jgi:hypothetical protein
MRSLPFALLVLGYGMVFTACHSPEYYAVKRHAFETERRHKILAEYPPSKTTRDYVLRRWRVTPQSEVRPPSGWKSSTNAQFRERVLASEERTRQTVYRCDHFLMPSGLSGGLLTAWFYYDANDTVIDADFPYQSD